MYIVRSGKKRGRGQYLTYVSGCWILDGMWYYTPKQRKARKFQFVAEARRYAGLCAHVGSFRVVKLKPKVKSNGR